MISTTSIRVYYYYLYLLFIYIYYLYIFIIYYLFMAPNRSIVPLLSLKLQYQASFPYKFKDYSWGDYIVLISYN